MEEKEAGDICYSHVDKLKWMLQNMDELHVDNPWKEGVSTFFHEYTVVL